MVEAMFNREKEIYRDMCERWRNIPKPTIAAVQGKCIAGGLMLCWYVVRVAAARSACSPAGARSPAAP
jgi:enoyl-CoA hydratase